MRILSEGKFRDFDGFELMGEKETSILEFDGVQIECTDDHRFLRDDGTWVEAQHIQKGETYSNKTFNNITKTNEKKKVYDAINVFETHSFYAEGLTIHNCNVVYLDEFAFINRADEFYTSTYPVITSGTNTKVIITSTANGVGNLFHRLWEGAIQGTNNFMPLRVDWWDVPGRDEEWKKETIENTSEIQFDQEFNNSFIGSGDTLISPQKLLELKAQTPLFEQDNVKVYEKPIPEHEYMMFVDVAKGRGQDYSTFTVIDVSVKPFKQVATYRDNNISPLLFPDIIYKYANTFNEAWIVVESNNSGEVVCNALYYDLEYENVFVESVVKANSIGVSMNKKVKRIGCSNIKDLIERNKLEVVDAETIIEMSTFVAKGQSYEASDNNHDDLMMNLVLFGWFTTTSFFSDMTDVNIRNMLYEERMKQIEDDLPPFGIIDDGLNEESEVIDGEVWTITPTNLF